MDIFHSTDVNGSKGMLTKGGRATGDLLVGKLTELPSESTGDIKLYYDRGKLSDLWIAATWN